MSRFDDLEAWLADENDRAAAERLERDLEAAWIDQHRWSDFHATVTDFHPLAGEILQGAR